MNNNPVSTPTKRKKLAPKSSAVCVRQAMAVIDQGRLLLEEAAGATGSSAHARRLRRLANDFVALHGPLAVIAGNCGGDEVRQ